MEWVKDRDGFWHREFYINKKIKRNVVVAQHDESGRWSFYENSPGEFLISPRNRYRWGTFKTSEDAMEFWDSQHPSK